MRKKIINSFLNFLKSYLVSTSSSSNNGIVSRLNLSGSQFERWMCNNFKYMRFDNISAALQHSVEVLVLNWITSWIKRTGISRVRLSGGVFMNVKLNQKVQDLSGVNQVTVCPSSGDETTVLGAIYATCLRFSYPTPSVKDLYLGKSFSRDEIEQSLLESEYSNQISYEYYDDIEAVLSSLLIDKKIVARFYGREEFGARALGNRSILCHPSNSDIIDVINQMIKDRDFGCRSHHLFSKSMPTSIFSILSLRIVHICLPLTRPKN